MFFNIAVHDVQPYTSTHFNMTHKIRHLSFGLNIPGKTNPMDDTTVIATEGMFLLRKSILLRIQWSALTIQLQLRDKLQKVLYVGCIM